MIQRTIGRVTMKGSGAAVHRGIEQLGGAAPRPQITVSIPLRKLE